MGPTDAMFDVAAVQAALLEHPPVQDCAVAARHTTTGEATLVAYVVISGAFAPSRLRAHLDATLSHPIPVSFVQVSSIPLTKDGDVDATTLERIPVLDDDALDRCRRAIAGAAPQSPANVSIGEVAERPRHLHLAELLPDFEGAAIPDEEAQPEPTRAGIGQRTVSNVAALSRGADPIERPSRPTTLGEALRQAVESSPDKGVIVLRPDGTEVSLSYPELRDRAERILGGLRASGLRPGDKVLLQFDRPDDFVAGFWGCTLGGMVPVPVSVAPSYREQNAVVARLQNVWSMLGRPVVLSAGSLAHEVRALPAVADMPGLQVHALDSLLTSPADTNWHQSAPDDLAILLLTSGSTGVPKAVMQSHRALLLRSAATAQMNGLTRDEISLNWLPLDHVGGIVMFHVHDVCLGAQQIHAETTTVLQDPLRWLDWMDRYRVSVTWAPNFAFGLVNAQAEQIQQRRWDLSALRLIINAGEAIVPKTARRFLELLMPHGLRATAMHPVWGMSETCSGVTFQLGFDINSTGDDALFVEVGAPIPGFAMRIVDASDRIVEESTIGRLQVSGPFVTSGYYQNPQANQDSFTADGWFKTGDLGRVHQGRLTITGREKDVIIVNGVNFYSHEIEKVVEDTPGVEVSFTAAFAIREPGVDTDRLAICFNPAGESARTDAELAALLREIRSRIIRDVGINPAYIVPVDRETIPKTAIGKIQRSELARRLQAGDFKSILRRVDVLLENARTIPDWFFRRVWRPRAIASTGVAAKKVLAFVNDNDLNERLSSRFAASGVEYAHVATGTVFGTSGRDFVVPACEVSAYAAVLAALARDGFVPDAVLHAWTLTSDAAEDASPSGLDAAQQNGLLSVVTLVQALSPTLTSDSRVRLLVASRDAQVVAATDAAGPHATLAGLLKTIPQEVPGLVCRHVDLDAVDVPSTVEILVSELGALDGEREIAYRDGIRYASRLAHLDMHASATTPWVRDGLYVVTGGLGALGREVCRELLQRFRGRVLLLGRSPIDAQRAAALQELQAVGHVNYEAVDIADDVALCAVVEKAEQQAGRTLDGIMHLAGRFDARLIADVDAAYVREAIRAKVSGTRALERLLDERPMALLVVFSSVNGYFGGFSSALYSAANAYADALVQSARGHGKHAVSLAWSLWNELGMSRGYALKDLSRARGYIPIGRMQGLQSWLAAVNADGGHILIGLDGGNSNIRRFVDAPSYGVQRVVATAPAWSADVRAHVARVVVNDRFGHPIGIDLRVGNASGSPDQQAPALGFGENPRTDLERSVAQVWQQVLATDVLDLDSNFFDLGATSLLMAQAHTRLQAVLGPRLHMTDLFRFPTVRALCAHVAKDADTSPDAGVETDQDRGRRRRESLRRRRPSVH
jgi:acyl-CoA synthetase (AMP-forming)/AMP-acid ligase II/NADP-dependent 3-hydroxy acid dehydrogenase YdfG